MGFFFFSLIEALHSQTMEWNEGGWGASGMKRKHYSASEKKKESNKEKGKKRERKTKTESKEEK